MSFKVVLNIYINYLLKILFKLVNIPYKRTKISFKIIFTIEFSLLSHVCSQQLAMLLITRQLMANLQEAIVPFITGRFHMFTIIVKASFSMSMADRATYLARAFTHICSVTMDEIHDGLETNLIESTDDDSSCEVIADIVDSRGRNISNPQTTRFEFLRRATLAQSSGQSIVISGEEVLYENRVHRFSADIGLTQVEVESSMQRVGCTVCSRSPE